MIEIKKIREDFPILQKKIYGKPLVYLDNAATTQKPRKVLDTVHEFYSTKNSNIHRGVHYLSEEASASYEDARETVKKFINAEKNSEIIFTQGTTDAVNLIAGSFGMSETTRAVSEHAQKHAQSFSSGSVFDTFIKKGNEIIVTEVEHHSNFVPWQMLCKDKGATLKILPVDNNGNLMIDSLKTLITDKTKLISLTYVSNVLGIINPIKEIIGMAHQHDIPVLIDGAQAVQHIPIDVQDLDCDFFAFSGHKMYAETGIGVLYGKQKWLDSMPPYRYGGGMISSVNLEKTSFLEPPLKFEAGTGNIAGAVSLKAAIEYINNIGIKKIAAYEKEVYDYAMEKLRNLPGVNVYGDSEKMCGAISFNLDNIHHYDAGSILDKMGIAVRTGEHCAEPLMKRYNIKGTVRASFAVYNTQEEVDKLVEGIKKVKEILQND